MKFFIRPKREPFIYFLARAGEMIARHERLPVNGFLKRPTEGAQKYDKKVEIAFLSNIKSNTPQRIKVEKENRRGMFGKDIAARGLSRKSPGFSFLKGR